MNCNKVVKLVELKHRKATAATYMEILRMMEHLLLPQNLYDSAYRLRLFPLIPLDYSQSPFTQQTSLVQHNAITVCEIPFKVRISTFLTTDGENLKHSVHLSLDIEVLFDTILTTNSRRIFFVRIHKKKQVLNIFYVFLFKYHITEKCQLL
jgi:hypothetical protein